MQLVAETWLQHAEDNADTAPKPVPLLLRDHQRDRTLAADASVLFSGEQVRAQTPSPHSAPPCTSSSCRGRTTP